MNELDKKVMTEQEEQLTIETQKNRTQNDQGNPLKIYVFGDHAKDEILIPERSVQGNKPASGAHDRQTRYVAMKYMAECGTDVLVSILREYWDMSEKADQAQRGKAEQQLNILAEDHNGMEVALETVSEWEEDTSKKTLHLKRQNGYIEHSEVPTKIDVNRLKGSDIVVIYNNVSCGFFAKGPKDDRHTRIAPDDFMRNISSNAKSLIVMRSRYDGDLLNKIISKKYKGESDKIIGNLILIFNIEELRWAGRNIRQGISWEQLAVETNKSVEDMKTEDGTRIIDACKAVLVRFKHEGCMLFYNGKRYLFYYCSEIEDDFVKAKNHAAFGSTSTLQAAIVIGLTKFRINQKNKKGGETEENALCNSIKIGMMLMRALIEHGYDYKANPEGSTKKGASYPYKYITECYKSIDKYLEFEELRRLKEIMDKKSNLDEKEEEELQQLTERWKGTEDYDDIGSYCGLEELKRLRENADAKSGLDMKENEELEELREKWKEKEKKLNELRKDWGKERPAQIVFQVDELQKKERITEKIINIMAESDRNKSVIDICKGIITNGMATANIPYLHLGKLITLDRNEVEHIRSIRRIVEQYKEDATRNTPLSICVFGRPGSGKSFAVKQIVKSLGVKPEDIFEFNLSQMAGVQDLYAAFHQIRDAGLRSGLPVAFFDEFDASIDKTDLAWLKYFLAPMQDGEFRENGVTHYIGKALFVFAGGTCQSMGELRRKQNEMVQQKLPDFLSRIKGYIDVAGPNAIPCPKPEEGKPENCWMKARLLMKREKDPELHIEDKDRTYIYSCPERTKCCQDQSHYLRRAALLRAQLEGKMKVKADDEIKIDDRVLDAFLRVEQYKHGARSLNAIVETSHLEPGRPFNVTSIDSNFLDLYATDDFKRYLRQPPKPDNSANSDNSAS